MNRLTPIPFSALSILLMSVISLPLEASAAIQSTDEQVQIHGIGVDYALAYDPNYRDFVGLTIEQQQNEAVLAKKYGSMMLDLQAELREIEDGARRGEIPPHESKILREGVFAKLGRVSQEQNIELAQNLRPDQRIIVGELTIGIHLQKQYAAHANRELAILTDSLASKVLRLSLDQDRKLKDLDSELKRLPIEMKSILIALELLQIDSVAHELAIVESQEKLIRKIYRDYERFKDMDTKLVIVLAPDDVFQAGPTRLETGWIIPDPNLLNNQSEDLDSLQQELVAQQWNRLEQIQLQWALKVSGLKLKVLHPDWIALLKLSDEQKRDWKKTIDKYRERFIEVQKERDADRVEAKSAVFKRFQQVLEPEQIHKLYRLLGKRVM